MRALHGPSLACRLDAGRRAPALVQVWHGGSRVLNVHLKAWPRDAVATSPAGAGAVRFEALDSWRGIAALLVVLFHGQIVSHIRDFPLVRSGEAMVDFFFVLSGFVIAHAYCGRIRDGGDFGKFVFLRLGRLYPLHLFMFGLFLAFEGMKAFVPGLGNPVDPAFSEGNAPSTIPANLLLLHALRPDGLLTWNTPSWSISAEFIAYIAFGTGVLLLRRRAGWIFAALLVAAPLLLAAFSDLGMGTTARMGAVRALYGFSAGAVLYVLAGQRILALRASAGGASHPDPRWTFVELALAVAALWIAVTVWTTPFAYAMPAVYCGIVAVFAVERGLVSRLLRIRPLLFLGLISYSLYMTHMFVQLRFTNLARLLDIAAGTHLITQVGKTARYGAGIDAGNPYLGDLLMLAMVAAVIGMSWMTYRLIEMPGQRLFRHYARKRRSGTAAA
ncbi:acyltransferase [Mesorhizobium ephedrae]|uniref:Acyltransferase n=1 Tax=Kumtagia ephedrae TaxID=2116701 RepID=A0A2P7STA3_9HYPH|nr:acyltransferase [Mesorhizobium ephedrae]